MKILGLTLLLMSPLVYAQSADSLILHNAVLMDSGNSDNDRQISIVIKGGIVELITEDLVADEDGVTHYDAQGGFVLGRLAINQSAAFLLLSTDPRHSPTVLLDTRTHASFGIATGNVIRNHLPVYQDGEKEAENQGWLAYTPPPLAVPTDYLDQERWNRFETRWVDGIALGAVVLDRQRWVDQDDASELQVGDLSEFEGGEIRGLRFGAVGTINFERPWVWTVFGATHAFDKGFDTETTDDASIFDLRLDIPMLESASFSIGKQKEPISMERLMTLLDSPMQERTAVADALLPSRNVGIVVAGNLFNDRMSLAGGVFNNWLDKDQPNSPGENSTQFVGRVTWLPLVLRDESALLHLGASLRTSNGKEAGVISTEPEFNQSPAFIQTSAISFSDSTTLQAEVSMRRGPIWLHSEYVKTELDDTRFGDTETKGYNVTASWIATGEMRPYNKQAGIFGGVPIARQVNQNGWGAWEFGARYSHFDVDDDPLRAGVMDIWSLGANWWLTPYVNVNFNYRFIELEQLGETGKSQGFNSRIVLILE